ncbi:tetratricopeptide repeat protein, partial [Reichenbachiella sp.]
QRNPYPDYYIGLNFMFLDNTDSAILYFRKAIMEAPYFTEVYNEIGNIFLRKQLTDSALVYFEKGLLIDPKSTLLNHNTGLTYFINKQPKRAQKYFLNNIGVNPDFVPSYLLAAGIYENSDNFHMAEIFYSKAITISENKVEYLIARGYYYVRQNELERAYLDFKSAESLDNLGYNELWQIALIELNKNQFSKGMKYLEQMSIIQPLFSENFNFKSNEYLDIEIAALLNLYIENERTSYEQELLGRLLSEVFFNKKNGTYMEAGKLLKMYPNSEIVNRVWIYSKASLYIKRDDVSYQLANNFITKIDMVQEKFVCPELYLLKATILYKYGAVKEALVEIQKLIKLNQTYAIAFFYQGNIFYDIKEYDWAIDSYTQAMYLAPDFLRAKNARGFVYSTKEKYQEAIEDFKSIISENSKDGWVYKNLAMCFQKMGKADSALFYYNRSLDIEPTLIGSLFNRGNLFLAENQKERALLDFNRAIELNSDFWPAREKRADILLEMGELKSAVDDYLVVLKFYQQEKYKFSNRGDSYLVVRKYQIANKLLISLFESLKEFSSAEKCKRMENEIIIEYSENYSATGTFQFQRKEYLESKKQFQIALTLNPNNYNAQHYNALASLCLGNVQEANELYRQFKSKANTESISNAIFILTKLDSTDRLKHEADLVIKNILSQ